MAESQITKPGADSAGNISVVVMTRDRRNDLLGTLEQLTGLPEHPAVVVVDNGSRDGGPAAARTRFPAVDVVVLGHNAGVAARNLGVRRVSTPYVAFNDDDSWWAPGALAQVVAALDRHPALGAVVAHVLVEPDGRDDPVSLAMQASPVSGDPALPGIPVLGFLACAAAVRVEAFDAVGGFDERLHFGGEEALLAADLVSAGWAVRYLPDAVVHHRPSRGRKVSWRRRREVRNALWFVWLRRPARRVLPRSWTLLRRAAPAVAASGLVQALAGLPWVLRERRVVPPAVEADLRRLD